MDSQPTSFFRRRINRSKFITFCVGAIFGLAIVTVLRVLSALTSLTSNPVFTIPALIILVIVITSAIIFSIKRLHDLDKSGWLSLLILVPIVQLGPIFYLAIVKGTIGPNKYGPDPLNPTLTSTNLDTSVIQPPKSKAHQIGNIVAGIVLIAIFWLPFKFIFLSGTKQTVIKNDPLVGKQISFGIPLLYAEGCTKCGETGEVAKIDRSLECPSGHSGLLAWYLYNTAPKITYVPSNMNFIVDKVLQLQSHGIYSIDSGTSPIKVVVLKDSNNISSTINASQLPGEQYAQYFCDGVPVHIDKLFRYTETKGRVSLDIALFDALASSTSNMETQQKLINMLPKNSHFSNIKPVDSSSINPMLAGITLDVDPDGLAFIVASKTDLPIWEITSLEPDYLKTLPIEDRTGIRTGLPYSFKPTVKSGPVTLEIKANGQLVR